jgi:hypothetical protein
VCPSNIVYAICHYDFKGLIPGEFGMYETRSVTEVARHFAGYINRVVYRGERFVLMRGNKPVDELGPLPVGRRLAELPDLLGASPKPSEAEAKEFADDLIPVRSMLSATDVRDPWVS